MEANTVTPIISASDIGTLTTTLSSNVSAIAPALLGLMAVILVPTIVFKFIQRRSQGK